MSIRPAQRSGLMSDIGAPGWNWAAGAFRLAFARKAPRPRKQSLQDISWSLNAADPSVTMFSGSFVAPDQARVPTRIWPAVESKGVAIVLHGAFDYSGACDEIGPKFAAEGITAFAYDQRGFGATRSRRHWCGKKRMVEDLV